MLIECFRCWMIYRLSPATGCLSRCCNLQRRGWIAQGGLDGRAEERLAFRELGHSIGLHAVPAMRAVLEELDGFDSDDAVKAQLSKLLSAADTARSIEAFWLDPAHQNCASWQGHEDINVVMLATSLMPAGFLNLHLPSPAQSPISRSRQA